MCHHTNKYLIAIGKKMCENVEANEKKKETGTQGTSQYIYTLISQNTIKAYRRVRNSLS